MGEIGDGTGTSYPAALDTDTTQYDVPNPLAQIVGADRANDVQGAILAIQAELGITGSQNFLRLDGTLAMAAALDLGNFGLTNTGPISGATTGSFSSTVNFPSGIIQADGSVGVGTTNPAAMLHIRNAVTGYIWSPISGTIAIFESAIGNRAFLDIVGKSVGQSEVWFGDEDSPNRGRIRYNHINDSLALWANETEKVTILSDNKVGINQITPVAMLEIDSATATDKTLILKGAASQSANLMELQDSASNVLHSIDKEGNPVFKILTAVPTTPVDGMLAIADGTTWNPGSGKGLYRYDGAAWNFCG